MPDPAGALSNTVTLVFEDDWFIASYVAAVIEADGGQVLGPFSAVEPALASLARLSGLPHAALLNVRLAEANSFAIADQLARGFVPLIFVTEHADVRLPHRFTARPLIPKPFAAFQIVNELKRIRGEAGQRSAGIRSSTPDVMRGH